MIGSDIVVSLLSWLSVFPGMFADVLYKDVVPIEVTVVINCVGVVVIIEWLCVGVAVPAKKSVNIGITHVFS